MNTQDFLVEYLKKYVPPDPECRLEWPEEPHFPIGFDCLFHAPPVAANPRDAKTLAVQSLWCAPYRVNGQTVDTNSPLYWGDRLSALCCFAYSALQLCKFYPLSRFITDKEGARLALRLELPYNEIHSSLEGLEQSHDPRVWVTGKLIAFIQDQPFIHLDSDAILFKPLPDRVANAKWAAQCADPLYIDGNMLSNMYGRSLLETMENFPELASFLTAQGRTPLNMTHAHNFGFFQCRNPLMLSNYVEHIVGMLEGDSDALDQMKEPSLSILIWEQFLISLFAFQRNYRFETLFPDHDHRAMAYKYGYVHFVAMAKRNQWACAQMVKRFQSDYPHHYELCRQASI